MPTTAQRLMPSPMQAMRSLLREDARFKMEAYQFIREALQFAGRRKSDMGEESAKVGVETKSVEAGGEQNVGGGAAAIDDPRHVTGGQLCHACRDYALDQFGALAPLVLGSWGIESTSDLGELVYNLIRIGQMRKSDSDRREDFNDVFDFETAFEPAFDLEALAQD